ncbi:MAG TPA: hypothetical protein DDZ66_03380, partial [Firmicutes bacterium]|nr:hypothetical protein [Bacillota bacterium]
KFSSADKLARHAGIAPVDDSSGPKTRQKRRLCDIIYAMLRDKTPYIEPASRPSSAA